jgi:hypothetical protein
LIIDREKRGEEINKSVGCATVNTCSVVLLLSVLDEVLRQLSKKNFVHEFLRVSVDFEDE